MRLASKAAAGKGGFKGGAKKFQYKPLSADHMQSRKNQKLGARDSYFAGHVKMFVPQAGDNTIRILPATWESGEGYGYEMYIHYGIGADRNGYLCLKTMKDEQCPICDERQKADAAGDDEYAKELRANKRIGVWVIDRAKEGEGPKFWAMPPSLERDMAAIAIDKKTGEVLQFLDPDEGYDFSFTKQGKDQQTKYVGPQFDRNPSPLSDDEDTAAQWLQYIVENPIPDILVFHDADHIQAQFGGGKSEDEDAAPKKGKLKPKLNGKKAAPEPEPEAEAEEEELPTWDEVHAMDEDALPAFAEKHNVDMSKEFDDLEDAQNHVCETLGIEKPEEKKPAKKGGLKLGSKKEDKEEKEAEAELPSWDEVHAMDEDALPAFAEEHGVDMSKEFDSLEDAQDHVCEALDIEKPKAAGKPSLKGKLAGLKAKAKK